MIRLLRTAAALPQVERLAAELRAPPANWRDERDRRIREIVAHAYRHTRFYRRLWNEAGVDLASIRGAEDLSRLPTVEQSQWRLAAPEEVLADYWRGPTLWFHTSGTSGLPPLDLPYALLDDSRVTAGMMAVRRVHGMGWSDLFAPSPALPPVTSRIRRVGRLVYLGSRVKPADLQAIVEAGRFPYIRCLPWPVWRAVVQSRRQGRQLPPLRRLFCAGEVLPEAVRRTLAEGLSTQVVNHYGAADIGHVAAECLAGRLHAFRITTHVEILAGEAPAPPGVTGEVVVTSFVSHARPAIRLRMGDFAAWGEGACACGSPVPHFAHVSGRKDDRVATPAGRTIRWPEVEAALAPLGDDLLGCQVEQLARDRAAVRLSLAAPPAALNEVQAALAGLFEGLAVEFALTDEFRVEAGGKTRPVVGLAGSD